MIALFALSVLLDEVAVKTVPIAELTYARFVFAFQERNMIKPNNLSGIKLISLPSARIKEILSGKYLIPNPDVKQLTFSFSEYFYRNGNWIGARDERGPREYHGTWRVITNKICIRGDNFDDVCRDLLIDKSTGALHITDPFSGSRANIPISVVLKEIQ